MPPQQAAKITRSPARGTSLATSWRAADDRALRRRRAGAFARLSSNTLRGHPALVRVPKRAAKITRSRAGQALPSYHAASVRPQNHRQGAGAAHQPGAGQRGRHHPVGVCASQAETSPTTCYCTSRRLTICARSSGPGASCSWTSPRRTTAWTGSGCSSACWLCSFQLAPWVGCSCCWPARAAAAIPRHGSAAHQAPRHPAFIGGRHATCRAAVHPAAAVSDLARAAVGAPRPDPCGQMQGGQAGACIVLHVPLAVPASAPPR